MSTRSKGLTALFLALAFAGTAYDAYATTAWAVDIINTDKTPQRVVINDSDGASKVFTLEPKAKLLDVCVSCVIVVGLTSVEATGQMKVKIAGGKAVSESQ